MSYFTDCHTPEQLRSNYRYWSKVLHPDMPEGDKVRFQQMQNEYESAKWRVNTTKNTMPNVFDRSVNYEYYRKSVKYVGVVYNHYYKFVQDFGADILIDLEHIRLVFEKRIMI